VLALAGTNVLAAITFGVIYLVAASRWLTQPAFLASLLVFFVTLTALWVHVERSQPGARDTVSRVGRGALALVLVVIGLPAVALAPLFALQRTLPAAAGLAEVIRPAMVLLMIALALVTAMNAVGTVTVAVVALWARVTRRRGAAP